LVEDDLEQATLFNHVLTREGYEVVLAGSAEAALARLTEAMFDLLLTDWYLPGINGDALIAAVKVKYPGMKTIICSSHARVSEVSRDVGADAWFCKVHSIARLRELVADLLT